jgi:ribosomal protein S18 acetylase RimI-like enzyme
MSIDIVPFQDDLIADAAELLAQRHARDRQLLPDLPPRFADLAGARLAIDAIWQRSHACGVAAVDAGRLLGYLIGEMVFDPVWGRQGWVHLPGYALAADQPADRFHELYAALGAHWVAHGCFEHFALVTAPDGPSVDAWFRLSFGLQQIYALLDPQRRALTPPSLPAGITIRQAVTDDRATLADLSALIWRHQVRAPIWAIHVPETEVETRASWAELVDDPTYTVWLAEDRNQVVGVQIYSPAEDADDAMHIPEACTVLHVGGTRAEARGRGIMTALTWHGLTQARERGYRSCAIDWRSTNVQAARAWTRQGFRPTTYRLVRRIDARIAWADGKAEG